MSSAVRTPVLGLRPKSYRVDRKNCSNGWTRNRQRIGGIGATSHERQGDWPVDNFWDKVEEQQSELRNLENERDGAMKIADVNSKRSRRLTNSVQGLYEGAFEAVRSGNDSEARRLLQEKEKVMVVLEKARTRAEANSMLAAKLEQAIGVKQHELLDFLKEMGRHLSRRTKVGTEDQVESVEGAAGWSSPTIDPDDVPDNVLDEI